MTKTFVTHHKQGNWEFDAIVAENFNIIAEKSIPNYKKVIGKCVQICKKVYGDNFDIKIIDVGSANGFTLKKFYNAGYKNIYGVENSKSMIENTYYKEKVIFSDKFPKKLGKFNFVCANWTLHFIKNRKQYLKDIYNNLENGGCLVVTDKMTTTGVVHDLYHDFKRSNGLSEEEIQNKKKAIEGVLVTKDLGWYFQTLKDLGFKNIEIIDADWCFVTLLCRK